MKLSDVRIDGSTVYYCKRAEKLCQIVASDCRDGATLIASGYSDAHYGELWSTEASCLTPAPTVGWWAEEGQFLSSCGYRFRPERIRREAK